MFNGLDALPAPADKRIRMEVQPAAERAIRGGHPWVFERGIRAQNRDGAPGDLAVIFDRKGRFVAVGLYDPDSVIRVKILQANDPALINADWFIGRMQAAFVRRASLARTDTNGYRMIHGENDGLPGFILDRYADTLVLKLYSAAWLPHLRMILPALRTLHPASRLVLRMSRALSGAETHGLDDGMALYGDLPTEPVIFHENGLTFSADVVRGHKTGFFFDQRENRANVRELSAGREVLDMFAYSGGFSVYAAAGGARSVLSADISEPALNAARANFILNRQHDDVRACDHQIRAGDAFQIMESLRGEGRRFGLVIVDAPSFAKSRDQVDGALMSYARLSGLATALLAPDGILAMSSCSSRVQPEDFFRAVHDGAVRPLEEIKRTFHPVDHPIGFPEGAYLKCLYCRRG